MKFFKNVINISDISFDLDTCDTIVVEFTNLLGP